MGFFGGDGTKVEGRFSNEAILRGPGLSRLFDALLTPADQRSNKQKRIYEKFAKRYNPEEFDADAFRLAPTSGVEPGRRFAFDEALAGSGEIGDIGTKYAEQLGNLAKSIFDPDVAYGRLNKALRDLDRGNVDMLRTAGGDFEDARQAFIRANEEQFNEGVRRSSEQLAQGLRGRGLGTATVKENAIANSIIPRALGAKLAARSNFETGVANARTAARSQFLTNAANQRAGLINHYFGSILNPALSANVIGNAANFELLGPNTRYGTFAQPSAIFGGLDQSATDIKQTSEQGGLGALAGGLAGTFFGGIGGGIGSGLGNAIEGALT